MEKVMFQCNYIYKDNQACTAITNNLNDVEDAIFALKEKEKQADRFCPEAVN
ncbi:hypothetical protein [Eggerthia catenaformis]|mgnify:CR=1 FL=1|uniref:hypothetical protein n=1 Tax=Eggerthia catenaformis TaxID=31973 RepID=UPI00248DAB97|nr:hypothetical protein [Eggerthia catenaformis]